MGACSASERLPLELEGVTSALILSAKASHIAKPHIDKVEREPVCMYFLSSITTCHSHVSDGGGWVLAGVKGLPRGGGENSGS